MSQISSPYPFDGFKEDRLCSNGEASSTITAGQLVYKTNDNTDQVKLTASGKPIGHVGIALNTKAAGLSGLKVRFLGRVTYGDLSTNVLDTTGATAAGDALVCAAAGAMATWATAAERRVGFVAVRSATVGEMFISGFTA